MRKQKGAWANRHNTTSICQTPVPVWTVHLTNSTHKALIQWRDTGRVILERVDGIMKKSNSNMTTRRGGYEMISSASSKSHEQVTPSVIRHLKRLVHTAGCRMKTLTERKWAVLHSGQTLQHDYKSSNNDNRSWNLQRCGGVFSHFFPPNQFLFLACGNSASHWLFFFFFFFFFTGIIVYFTFILYFHIRRRGLCPISWISSLLLTAVLTAQWLLLLS